MFKMIGVLVFLTILCSINGSLSEKKRIHGGHEINAPFVVFLERTIKNGSEYVCTASLIKPQYILTAAHCLEGAIRATVTYGCNDLRNKNECKVVTLKNFRKHPNHYQEGEKGCPHDIAVAILSHPIEGITPIRLPNPYYYVYSGTMATLMGWGRTEIGHGQTILLSITRPIAEVRKEKILVNYTNEKRTDKGDSGGPLLIGKTIFGVAQGSDMVHKVGIFMNVNHYLGFIYESIEMLRYEDYNNAFLN